MPNTTHSKDLHALRAAMNNNNAQLTLKAELGKIGFNLTEGADVDASQLPKSEQLTRRAELRRASNALMAHAKAKPENLTEDVVRSLEAINAEITIISNSLDLNDAAEAHMSGISNASRESALFDQEGNQVGTLLNSADLGSAAAIAAKLGTVDRSRSQNSLDEDNGASLTDFFRGIANMRTSEGVRNTLSVGTNTAGGYTVPTVLLPGILNALVPASALLTAGMNVAVLDTPAKSFSIAATAAIPTASWRKEHGQVAESEPAFRSIEVTPRSLAFRFKISRELLMDSPNIEPALRTAIAQAFAVAIDRASLLGSGDDPEIRGLRNIEGIHKLPAGANGAELKNWARFINATRLIKEANAPAPTAAIMSPREEETIALFADTTGQPLRRPTALEGWRLATTSQLPTNIELGTADDTAEIFIGDFSLFTLFMREGISVQLLNELYAETGEVGFICHTRLDVAAMYAKAFAVLQGVRAPAIE
ncbi:phage major capsid protein [Stenotrophomonas rhizophila]|uniref:HK97 family phage major capsid protein n=1 Tax=Stenotrophomonas rhizophila TaxID=216778 RepID=A0AAW5PJF8_9GAMM|nr:phage major capsid protein [Stenotrophomonas rhizophila]MCS4280526.1 HK97 family phage major capsid protein [Stenotrophomonas rhizophila]